MAPRSTKFDQLLTTNARFPATPVRDADAELLGVRQPDAEYRRRDVDDLIDGAFEWPGFRMLVVTGEASTGKSRTAVGELARQRGDLEEAERWFRESMTSGHLEAVRTLAEVLLAQGRDGEADDLLLQADMLGPENPAADD